MTGMRAPRADVAEKSRIATLLRKHRERLAAVQDPIARARVGRPLLKPANEAELSSMLDRLVAAREDFLRETTGVAERGSQIRDLRRAFDRAIELARDVQRASLSSRAEPARPEAAR